MGWPFLGEEPVTSGSSGRVRPLHKLAVRSPVRYCPCWSSNSAARPWTWDWPRRLPGYHTTLWALHWCLGGSHEPEALDDRPGYLPRGYTCGAAIAGAARTFTDLVDLSRHVHQLHADGWLSGRNRCRYCKHGYPG